MEFSGTRPYFLVCQHMKGTYVSKMLNLVKEESKIYL